MISFSDETKYELIPEGMYEVILSEAEEKTAKSGTKYLSCKYVIRDDVDQGCQGRVIFESIFRDKNNPDSYDKRKIERLLQTQGKKADNPNARYEFEDNDEIIQHINGLYMLVTINNKPADEYHNDPYNEIRYLSYKPTKHPLQGLEVASKQVSLNADDDADLPF